MSEKDKGQIMEQIKNLPENEKQFVLGYAAGIAAKAGEQTEAKPEKNNDQ